MEDITHYMEMLTLLDTSARVWGMTNIDSSPEGQHFLRQRISELQERRALYAARELATTQELSELIARSGWSAKPSTSVLKANQLTETSHQ